jgi:hypothetical protein
MGFFSKIKSNLTHGGVKLQLQMPDKISLQDAFLPVTVNLAAGDTPATIKKVKVELIAESQDMAFSQPSGSANPPPPKIQQQTVAQAENNEQFTLGAGETKAVNLQIIMNQGNALQSELPQGSAGASIAHALGQLQSFSESNNNANRYNYSVNATAYVDGITFEPSDSHPIQVLKPGEIGGGIKDYRVKL